MKSKAGDTQACPAEGAGLPRGLHGNWREVERGSECERERRERGRKEDRKASAVEHKYDRCPGVKGDNLPAQ